MKIAYCLKGTFNSGGMERIVIGKANALKKLGYDVTIITTDQLKRQAFFKIDSDVKCIDLGINYDEIEGLPFVKKLIRRNLKIRRHKKALNEVCQKEKFDIIISTFGNEIRFLHSIKGVNRRIAEIHFNREFRTLYSQSKFKKLVNKWLVYSNEIKASKLDAFVCLTNEDSHQWKRIKNKYIIPNFIEKKASDPSSVSSKNVIAVGRLTYQKGYDYMLKAWQKVIDVYPDWTLDIYGNGESSDSLLKLRKVLKLEDSVVFHDPTKDIYSKLSASSIYCMSSRFEGMPMVLLEAMACGLPIVSFECKCGPKDLLSDNNTGFLVPTFDIDKLAESICTLIADDKKRKQMGSDAYHEADKYLLENIIPHWVQLFESLNKN